MPELHGAGSPAPQRPLRRPRRIVVSIVLLLLGVSGVAGNGHAPDVPRAPGGLTRADWTAIRALLPPAQQAYLKASNPGASDGFGQRVAVSGPIVAVGARHEDSMATGINGDQQNNSAPDAGAVYLFERQGAAWVPKAYLKASNTGVGDRFGQSLALSAHTLVVGAYQEDSAATGINGDESNDLAIDSGAVYIFIRDSEGGWHQQAYLKASNTESQDFFGYSVAIAGDTLCATIG